MEALRYTPPPSGEPPWVTRAADNAAAVHNERGIVADVHTAAAITISVIRFSRSSGDHAAGYLLRAATFIQYPQAVAVRGKFMPRGRITVRNRQRTTAFHHKDAVTICIVFILEYMTVQVKGHSSIDNQRGVNGNVSCQLDGFIRIIGPARQSNLPPWKLLPSHPRSA